MWVYAWRGPDPPSLGSSRVPGECQGRRWPGKGGGGRTNQRARRTRSSAAARSGGATREGDLSLNPLLHLPLPLPFKDVVEAELSATARPLCWPGQVTPVTDRGGAEGPRPESPLHLAFSCFGLRSGPSDGGESRCCAARSCQPGRDGSSVGWEVARG